MDGSFAVIVPDPLLRRLRMWAEDAKREQLGTQFLEALRDFNRRIEFEPSTWGDPLFDYSTIDAVECRGIIEQWFVVWYGLHIASRTVIVRDIQPAPGSSLTSEGY